MRTVRSACTLGRIPPEMVTSIPVGAMGTWEARGGKHGPPALLNGIASGEPRLIGAPQVALRRFAGKSQFVVSVRELRSETPTSRPST